MSESFAIAEVIRRTGLTSRALRFYEARALITPLRTHAGRRWFAPADLERVHHIVALKRAGQSLSDIKRLFDRKPVNLGALLEAQRERLGEQQREVSAAIALIDTALSRIGRGEPLDAATLCSLIRDGDTVMTDQAAAWRQVVDRYYTPTQQAEWRDRMATAPEFGQAEYLEKWRALSARIEGALPLDPASDLALGFVREWFALLEPFTRNATRAMWEGSMRMYEDMDKWESTVDAGFSKPVWAFIVNATAVARTAGHDVGTLPAFMTTT